MTRPQPPLADPAVPANASAPDAVLEGHRFARPLPDRVRGALARAARTQSFPPGTMLFAEGEAHPQVYLVERGDVRLDMHVPGRGDVPLLTVGPGELLGWSPFLGEGAMTARATTAEETVAVVLPAAEVRRLCEADPKAGYHLMRQLAAALSARLIATRLQLLDFYAETTPPAATA
ncbi:Crp/Fnr family transcriptional regulator [Alienimonas sp. DA493]|uniref:Crp/Fnr family transcriptional regulator n=1 Tax=Alienimonas sp. DA493 TaxID=3373605 RepID=UPI00375461A8